MTNPSKLGGAALGGAAERTRFLLIDTCGGVASVAVAEGREIVRQREMPGRSASEELLGSIAEMLRECSWGLEDLSAIAVVRGPGSFTGIRVGVSAAKGLAEASGRPLIALSRLEVMAKRAPAGAIVALDAGRGEVFWAEVRRGEIGEQSIAKREWLIEHARKRGVPVLEEQRGSAEAASESLRTIPALTAADALLLTIDRFPGEQWDDVLLLDGLYLHRTEQEILARQRAHRSGVDEGTKQS